VTGVILEFGIWILDWGFWIDIVVGKVRIDDFGF